MGFVLNGNTLVQSGTDADLTGLRNIAGVQVTGATAINQVYILPDTIALINVAGDLQIDPTIECLVCGVNTRMEVQNAAVLRFGKLLTVSGKPQYSRGIGLVMNRSSGTQNTIGANIFLRNGSQLIGRGGTIKTATSLTASANAVITVGTAIIDIEQTELLNLSNLGIQILRLFLPNANVKLQNVFLTGRVNQGIPFSSLGFDEFSGEIDFASIQVDGNGAKDDQLYGNITFANNKATRDYSYVAAGNNMNLMNRTIFQNPDIGSLIRTLGLNANQPRIGLVEIRKDVLGTVASDGLAVENAVQYMSLKGASVTPSAGTRFAATDYLTPRKYTTASTSLGEFGLTDVLYATAQSYNTGAGGSPLTMDSLTTRANDVQTIFVWSYDHLLSSFDIPMRGVGSIDPEATMFIDPNVTLSRVDALAKLASSFVIDTVANKVTVTADSNYDEVYDALKAFKASTVVEQIEAPVIGQTIVTANGELITAFAGYELIVNAGVTLSEGDRFKRIKFDTVTVNGAITGVFSTTAGTSKIVEITASEGSSIYVGDVSTGITKLFLSNVAAGTYRAFYEPSIVPAVLIARELYGFQRFQEVVTLADGLNVFTPIDIEDIGITEGTLATVEAYTELELPTKFYDRTASFRLSEQGIKLGQIVTRSGSALEISSFSHVINKDANLVYSIDGSVITTKSISYSADNRYNTEVLASPFTLTANSDEVLDIAIEDANGDSQISIDGGDGTFELYKVTTATATNDFATGTLIATVGNGIFRFIGEDGFDVIGIDINSNIRRRTSFSKGIYTQAFFVGDQIQLAQAPQVVENGVKLDILQLEINEIKGTGFVSSANSLKAIGVTVTDLGTPLQAADYVEADNASIAAIKAKTDSLQNADLSAVALEASVQAIKTKTDTLVNADLTNIALEASVQAVKAKTDTLVNADLSAVALEATSQEIKTAVNNIDGGGVTLAEIEASTIIAKEATSQQIRTKVNTLNNTDLTLVAKESTSQAIKSKTDSLQNADLSSVALETSVQAIKSKTDSLVNTDLSLVAKESTVQAIKSKTDSLQNADLSLVALESSVQEVKDGIGNVTVDNEAIALEVWENQPERLKNVATVESTGDQIVSA